MSILEFNRATHAIRLIAADGSITGPFVAYNNVDSHSNGPWPNGTYSFIGHNSHAALSDPNSEYGADGILIFAVPNRAGMGVHSGRLNIPDGLGRLGPQHCTLGCIRTIDEAVATFLEVMVGDPMQSINVLTPAAAVAVKSEQIDKSQQAIRKPSRPRKKAKSKPGQNARATVARKKRGARSDGSRDP